MSDARCPKCAEGKGLLFEPVQDESPAGCRDVVARLVPGGAIAERTGGFREFEAEVRCAACSAVWVFESERPSGGPRQGPFDTAPDALQLYGRTRG
jgi:hypothetical protein